MADPKQPKQKNTPKKLDRAPNAPEVVAELPPGQVRCEDCLAVVDQRRAIKRSRPDSPDARWACGRCNERSEMSRGGLDIFI